MVLRCFDLALFVFLLVILNVYFVFVVILVCFHLCFLMYYLTQYLTHFLLFDSYYPLDHFPHCCWSQNCILLLWYLSRFVALKKDMYSQCCHYHSKIGTKMIHSTGIKESNLVILIMYFPEGISPGVSWYVWSLYCEASSSSFSGLARRMIGLIHFCLSCYLTIWGEVTLLCHILKIGWRKIITFEHSFRHMLLWVHWGAVVVYCEPGH